MLLITPQEIINCAFLNREKISQFSIRDVKIDIAQEHFIRPRFGNAMFDAMTNGKYADFVERYIKPALAHFVRYGVVDELAIQVSDNGVILYSTTQSLHVDTNNKDITDKLNGTTTVEGIEESLLNKTLVSNVEDNKTITESSTKTTINEAISTNVIANETADVISSNPITKNETNTQNENSTTNSQTSKNENTTRSETGGKSLNSDVARFREATPIERRVITQRALSDAKILLAKAVRYVESNGNEFELYIPSNYSHSIFF